MKKLLFITLLSTALLFGQGISVTQSPILFSTGDGQYELGKISPNGKSALLTAKGFAKIELVEIATGKSKIITENSPGCGWGMKWNANSDKFLFKINSYSQEDSKSVSLFEYRDGTGLTEIAKLNPATNNLFFYSVNGDGIMAESGKGEGVALRNDATNDKINYFISKGKMMVIDPTGKLKPGVIEQIALKENVLFAEWSPSGTKLALHCSGKGIYILDFTSGSEYNLPKSEYPSWINDDYLTFMQTEDDGYYLLNSEVIVSKFDGTESSIVTQDFKLPAMFPSASEDGSIIFSGSDNKIYIMKVDFTKN